MPVATRRELLEAGVHFGHQTRRWNPKMRRFIFGERSGIYIIDLEKTLTGLQSTYDFLLDVGRRGGSVLFVGTKKQAQEVVAREAGRVAMPFVNTRWLGGMLTNFTTIHGRLQRMKELREMERSGAFEYLPKKEVLRLRHEKEKLERNLSGIQDMERRPDAIFVIDTKREHIAVKEARKLGIPVLAIVDTNCDPDEVDYVIPGNDDAIRACSLITKVIADALQEGQYLAYQGMQTRATEPEFEQEPASPAAEAPVAQDDRRPVRLSEDEAAFFGEIVGTGGDTEAPADMGAADAGEAASEPEPEPQTPADATAGDPTAAPAPEPEATETEPEPSTPPAPGTHAAEGDEPAPPADPNTAGE
jgi:small subunit ribosomal protein S2